MKGNLHSAGRLARINGVRSETTAKIRTAQCDLRGSFASWRKHFSEAEALQAFGYKVAEKTRVSQLAVWLAFLSPIIASFLTGAVNLLGGTMLWVVAGAWLCNTLAVFALAKAKRKREKGRIAIGLARLRAGAVLGACAATRKRAGKQLGQAVAELARPYNRLANRLLALNLLASGVAVWVAMAFGPMGPLVSPIAGLTAHLLGEGVKWLLLSCLFRKHRCRNDLVLAMVARIDGRRSLEPLWQEQAWRECSAAEWELSFQRAAKAQVALARCGR